VEGAVGNIGVDAIERILAATGAQHIPRSLDKNELAAGLEACQRTYVVIVERNSDRRVKNEIRRLKLIQAAAVRFNKQMTGDDIWSSQDWEVEHVSYEVDSMIRRLEYRINDLEYDLRWGPDFLNVARLGIYKDTWKAYSPFEWLAGHYLPKLFEEQVGLKPAFHRHSRDNLPDGPVIRFTEQALAELGVTRGKRRYSRESIAKAMTDIRSGRRRKKVR
jgi:hypothetical protein